MSSAPMPVRWSVPVSADSAYITVDVTRRVGRVVRDRDSDLLLECIAAAYRAYHQSDDIWTLDRNGERRIRLVGQLGTAAAPRRHYISVDLEDFQ